MCLLFISLLIQPRGDQIYNSSPPALYQALVFLPVQGRWGGPLPFPQPILEARQQEEVVKLQGSLGCMGDAALGSPRLECGRCCPLLKLSLVSMCGKEACWSS